MSVVNAAESYLNEVSMSSCLLEWQLIGFSPGLVRMHEKNRKTVNRIASTTRLFVLSDCAQTNPP